MTYSTEKNIMLYLTGQQTETDVTVEELETISQQYPYFGAAKFLLAKKAQQTSNPGFEVFAQNAVVHFANPYWFRFKLNEEQLMNGEFALFNEIEPVDAGAEKPSIAADAAYKAVADVTNLMVNRQDANDAARVKEDIAKEIITTADDVPAPAEKEQPANDKESSTAEPLREEGIEKQPTEEIGYTLPAEYITTEIGGSEELVEKMLAAENEADEIVPAVYAEDVPLDRDDVVPAVLPEDVPLDKDDIVPAVEITNEDIKEEDDIIPAIEVEKEQAEASNGIIPAVEHGADAYAETEDSLAIAQDEHPDGPTLHIPGTGEDNYTTEIDNEDAEDVDYEEGPIGEPGPVSDKISAVLKDQLQEFKKPVAVDAPVPIETEPYHTVDYFASQGIKLSLEQQKQDNLGVKVRKFTDWLKQMKRVSPTPADLGIDEAAEHKVQSIAATSNEVKEVVTEAMAEVLAMQGMNEKAIQVYKKLSFLEPTKSAYFAAKIDNLKG